MMAEEILGEAGGEESATEEVPTTALTTDETTEAADGVDSAVRGDDADDTTQVQADGRADVGQDGVPAEYAAFTVPDGMQLDADALAAVTPIFKEAGMTQETAQKLIDVQSQLGQQAAAQQQAAWADQQTRWLSAAQMDEEFGKSKYDESIGLARRTLREVGTPELSKALDDSGMGNHPEFIRILWRIGKAIGEDTISFGLTNQEGGKTLAERLFPNQGKAA
jgi:hypothetical protein